MAEDKIIIYQVFTRLFGSARQSLVVNGSIQENGCGHLSDFTQKALEEIRQLGITHIWYTGLIEHATQTDYSTHGIQPDCAAVVKGKAGSPYAIKDYYDIDPDLADDVPQRMKEFQNLVTRTHRAGLKMVIDFVPNHVARQYRSDSCPPGVHDLGADDHTDHAFHPQNNFYYLPGQSLHTEGFSPLPYEETPAKASGNDVFSSWPSRNDWYETVKLNYGVDYMGGHQCHFDPIPSTWQKMTDILLFWASKGVDAFRCDMAEMVPVEFWNWAIDRVKQQYPHIRFIAEVYNPGQYRSYIHFGGFDYLYDKVGLYDTLKAVIRYEAPATSITSCWQSIDDIKSHMLNFLENHDEQRIASDFFAGQAIKGRPALLVSTLMGQNPMMIYFGQELGEPGMDAEGFSGRDGRTTIFDYWSVDTIRRWRHSGKFSGTLLTDEEKALQDYYRRVLTLALTEKDFSQGAFFDLMYVNPDSEAFDAQRHYAFLRGHHLVVANFSPEARTLQVHIPQEALDALGIKPRKKARLTDLLNGTTHSQAVSADTPIEVSVQPWSGAIIKL